MIERFLKIEGVEVEVLGNRVKVKGEKGTLEKEFKLYPGMKIEVSNNTFKVISKEKGKKFKALVGTILAHFRNMVRGVKKGFVYKLKIVYSHFPISVRVEGNKFIIQNFLGEKTNRVAEILENVEVEVKGQEVIVKGIDIEKVSQTAANIENATKIKAKDRRVFQDGIYIVEKGKK